jgi:hypothetical protein
MNLQMTAILVVSIVSISHLSGPKNCIIWCGGLESTGHDVQGFSNYSGQAYSSSALTGAYVALCKENLVYIRI